MVRLVIDRSRGRLQELRVKRLQGDTTLQTLAQSDLSSLKTLCIPKSVIPQRSLCQLIPTLPGLVHLDISECRTINSKALKIIGLTCQYMPKLKHLLMSLDWVSTSNLDAVRASLDAIHASGKDFEFVDVKSGDDEYDPDEDYHDEYDEYELEDDDYDTDEEDDEEDTDDLDSAEVKSVDDDEHDLDDDYDYDQPDYDVEDDEEDDEDDPDEEDEDDETDEEDEDDLDEEDETDEENTDEEDHPHPDSGWASSRLSSFVEGCT